MSPKKSRKEWDPRVKPPPELPRLVKGLVFEELANWLKGVTILEIEGNIDLTAPGPVYIAVVHDGSSYHPGGMLAVDQSNYYDLSSAVLETAFNVMKDHVIEHSPEYVEELKQEWGDRWEEILTESFGGDTFTINLPEDAAFTIQSDLQGRKLLEIVEE